MFIRATLALASAFTFVLALPPDVYQQGGSDKLLSTSFGIPGQNASYVYIVCPPMVFLAYYYSSSWSLAILRLRLSPLSCISGSYLIIIP